MKTLILIPTYNVEKTIGEVFERIPKEIALKSQFLVVDNNSQDGTVKIVEKLSNFFPIELIKHSKNLGYGASQKTGFNYALEAGSDCVVMLHSDGQYSPELLPEFIKWIERGFNVVAGASYDMLKQGMPFHRYLGNIFLTGFANLIFKTKIHSWHSGYRAYSKKALETIKFMEFSNYYEFDSEMIIGALKNKLKIKEIPITRVYRGEKSYLNSIIYGFRVIKVILKHSLR